MEPDVAAWLVSAEAGAWLARAAEEPDPGSLAAAARWRRDLPVDRAAVVLAQAELRRSATRKLGALAGATFLTRDGLEQATRPEVAAWRAGRFLAAGVRQVWDLGCGLGLDAQALVRAGLDVVAVEQDPATAILAQANLTMDAAAAAVDRPGQGPGSAEVLVADVAGVLDRIPAHAGVFLDPARRTGRGRSWDVADLSPSWDVVQAAAGGRTACVKLGPGVPYSLLPDDAETIWVSDHGDLVEAAVWTGPASTPRRAALLLPGNHELAGGRTGVSVGTVGSHLYEPDPAVIRAGAVGALAEQLGAHAVAEGIAYLTADRLQHTPYASAFEVLEHLPYRERDLRAWVRAHAVGTLEIKKRGVDVDPAALRKRLAPQGPNAATLVLTPTVDGAQALVVRRCRARPSR